MELTRLHSPRKHKGNLYNLALIILTLTLSACTSTRQVDTLVRLDEYSTYQLQAVPINLQGLTTLQQLIVTTSTEQHQLLLQTELFDNQIKMVGLSPAGLVLFELNWVKGASLELSSNIPMKDLYPELMLAYYQLSNWPAKDVVKGLVGMRLLISSQSHEKREFYRGKQQVFTVEHHFHSTKLVHQQDRYQIEILTLEQRKIE